jgi:hypothetical protein
MSGQLGFPHSGRAVHKRSLHAVTAIDLWLDAGKEPPALVCTPHKLLGQKRAAAVALPRDVVTAFAIAADPSAEPPILFKQVALQETKSSPTHVGMGDTTGRRQQVRFADHARLNMEKQSLGSLHVPTVYPQ